MTANFIAARFALLLAAFLLPAACWATGVQLNASGRTALANEMVLQVDRTGEMTFDDVERSTDFFDVPVSSAGFPTHEVYWGRVSLSGSPDVSKDGMLLMDPTLIGRIDVYSRQADGSVHRHSIDEAQPISDRPSGLRSLVFNLAERSSSTQVVYIRFSPNGQPLQTRLFWIPASEMPSAVSNAQLVQGLLFGALLALLAYNSFLWYATRDLSYGLYVYYLGSFSILMAFLTGTRPAGLPGVGAAGLVVMNCAVIHGGVWFFHHFLELRKHCPTLGKAFTVLQWTAVILAVGTLLGGAAITSTTSILMIGVAETALIVVSVARWRQGYEPARWSTYGLLVHATVSTLFVTDLLGIVQVPGVTIYAIEMAAVWEALLFSFALAYRVRLAEQRTARHLAEQKLALAGEQKALAAANAATKEKNVVLSMISHELRSPLQAIVSAIDVERTRNKRPEDMAFIRRIERAASRIASQLRDLFILSVGDAGRLEMRPEPFEVRELVEEVVLATGDMEEAHGLSMNIFGPDDSQFVVADPTRVEQILSNLVENAVKYTKEGRVDVRFSVGSGMLTLQVADTGIGISPQQQAGLFVPFRRFASVERDRKSSGIGLAVVKTLVTHLGGTVELESKLGVGSTFTVKIPVVEVETPDDRGRSEGLRLLIVDDRHDVLEALGSVAEALGYACDRANSAATGANDMAAYKYDVILIDLDMPLKSGMELASEIRRGEGLNADSFLVAISAGEGHGLQNKKDAELWPFDAFCPKPIDRIALAKVIELGMHGPS